MKRNTVLTIGSFVVIAIALLLISAVGVQQEKYAYIENENVFSEFKLTEEYRIKFEKIEQARQSILDSLELQIQIRKASLPEYPNDSSLAILQQQLFNYEQTKARFTEQNQTLSNQYNEVIWNQLNSYIQNYGEEKGYEMIFGASGAGNVMYARGSMNITEELIQYVNNSFDGKK